MRQAHSETREEIPAAGPTILERYAPGTWRNPLQVTWFRQWNTTLDHALSRLPESDACPHRLFRLLSANPTGDRKPIALVQEKGVPVAIAALRRTADQRWVPVTHYIVPGSVLPSQPGRLLDAVASLGVPVDLGFWRSQKEPEINEAVRLHWYEPTSGMGVADDWEAYWRKTGRWDAIRKSRRKCSDLSVRINQPGATRSIITAWGQNWGIHEGEIADRLVAAEYLESAGRHVSIMLTDSDRQVGGASCFIHDGELVAGVYFRSREYDRFDVGTYIIYLAFEMVREFNLRGFDLGGGQSYKKRYAPIRGKKLHMRVCGSFMKYQIDRAVRKLHPAWASPDTVRSG